MAANTPSAINDTDK